jgi:hypothetical protein
MIAKEYYTNDELQLIEGEFLNSSGFLHTIEEDIDIYKPNGELLAIFRKNAIPLELSRVAFDNLKGVAKQKRDNRGKATGKLDLSKIPIDTNNIIQKDEFRVTKYKLLSGQISKRSFGNLSQSNILGYYEKPDRNYSTKVPCRLTSFSARNFNTKWKAVLPFIICIDDLYKRLAPNQYNNQITEANKTEFHIPNTSFSTITANYNFRTALHKDSGDYKKGLSAFTVSTDGEYKGFLLGFPKYRIAIDVRDGDLLLFNPHEYHCNTEYSGDDFTRLSFVLYLRDAMASRCAEYTVKESIDELNEISLEKYKKPYLVN